MESRNTSLPHNNTMNWLFICGLRCVRNMWNVLHLICGLLWVEGWLTYNNPLRKTTQLDPAPRDEQCRTELQDVCRWLPPTPTHPQFLEFTRPLLLFSKVAMMPSSTGLSFPNRIYTGEINHRLGAKVLSTGIFQKCILRYITTRVTRPLKHT